jgi:hypothetical protein
MRVKNSEIEVFLQRLKKALPELEKLLKEVNDHWNYEDGIYRFYHQSFKVFSLQSLTQKIVLSLKELWPDRPIHPFFEEILKEGTDKEFEISMNKAWSKNTRPILEAFLHAKYFLEMAVKYAKELDEAPMVMPSGWAGLLYFYEAR